MFKTRTIGFGLVVALGLLLARPAPADEACQRALADIDRATATLNDLQHLRDEINQRQQTLRSQSGAVADTMKCPACGMTMTTEATAQNTRAVTINGKTWYCCAGCDMSKITDKQ